jgi:Sec-independent protein secretion pathway component TatC
MFELLVLVYAIGAVATFFWIGNMSTPEKGFIGAFLVAIPLALIWPIALIVLLLVAEKKKSN